MIDLTIAFYSKDRYGAVYNSLGSVMQTTPKGVKFLLIEDSPKNRFRNSEEYKKLKNQFADRILTDLSIIEIPRKSSCGQLMNRCITDSNTRYVLFCNDDLIFNEGWFELAIEKIEQGNELILMYNYGACLVDKAAIPRLGWFDERFLGGNREDQDMNIRVISKEDTDFEVKNCNTWNETGEKLIQHEPVYYSSACWNGEQNEKYFIEKWGTIDYGLLCRLAKEKRIQPKFQDIDWYPSITAKYLREYK